MPACGRDALAVLMKDGRVAGSATCSRVFTTSRGLVRKLLVRPAMIAEPTWTVITCDRGAPLLRSLQCDRDYP